MSNIGMRLIEEREKKGLTQTEFGLLAGVTKKTQIRYEKELSSPNAEYLTALLAHGVDILYLLTGSRSSGVRYHQAISRATAVWEKRSELPKFAVDGNHPGFQYIADFDMSDDALERLLTVLQAARRDGFWLHDEVKRFEVLSQLGKVIVAREGLKLGPGSADLIIDFMMTVGLSDEKVSELVELLYSASQDGFWIEPSEGES